MKKTVLTTLMVMMSTVALQANVSINSASFQKHVELKGGEKVTTWIKASKVVPGTIIRYVNSLENSGTQTASKLVINNPIPANMEYVASTASCKSDCSVVYSVDGGKTFKEPSELFVGEGKERHVAKASEYTDIRWTVDALAATSQSSVEYKARLK
jgi:uncharacterized repeat protein (TIGR01451 family)